MQIPKPEDRIGIAVALGGSAFIAWTFYGPVGLIAGPLIVGGITAVLVGLAAMWDERRKRDE